VWGSGGTWALEAVWRLTGATGQAVYLCAYRIFKWGEGDGTAMKWQALEGNLLLLLVSAPFLFPFCMFTKGQVEERLATMDMIHKISYK